MVQEYLTVTEVAAHLGVRPETVRRWLRGGRMPAVALSRKAGYRIRKADFQAFLQERSGRKIRELERERA